MIVGRFLLVNNWNTSLVDTLPIFINLKNKPVLVVGGGDVALRKIQTLLKVKAIVTVISPEFCQQLLDIENPNLTLETGYFESHMLDDKWLAVAGTDNEQVNQQVHDEAVKRKIWVNVVDNIPLCQFITPAIIDRSPIVMAITSGGDAPVLARLWKEKFESLLPQWTGKLATVAGNYRSRVKKEITEFRDRRHFWERFFRGDIAALAAKEDWQGVEETIEQTLAGENQLAGGCFYVCYGDGDAQNLTLKALQAMQLADVIYYEKGTNQEIIDLCRKDADQAVIDPSTITNKINQHISEGEIVCRLIAGKSSLITQAKSEIKNIKTQVNFVEGLKTETACWFGKLKKVFG